MRTWITLPHYLLGFNTSTSLSKAFIKIHAIIIFYRLKQHSLLPPRVTMTPTYPHLTDR